MKKITSTQAKKHILASAWIMLLGTLIFFGGFFIEKGVLTEMFPIIPQFAGLGIAIVGMFYSKIIYQRIYTDHNLNIQFHLKWSDLFKPIQYKPF